MKKINLEEKAKQFESKHKRESLTWLINCRKWSPKNKAFLVKKLEDLK